MKVKLDRNKLLQGLKNTINFVPQRSTMTILQNFMFEIKENDLYISASNLDQSCNYKMPIEEKDFMNYSFTINAKKIIEIVSAFKSNHIFLTIDNNKLKIKGEKETTEFKSHILSSDDFPNINKKFVSNVIKLKAKQFKESLSKVSYAVSLEDSRYFLNGVYFEKEKEQINFVATDGRRMSYINLDENSNFEINRIVPLQFINNIINIIDNSDDEIEIEISESYINAHYKNYIVNSTLLEGNFPEYKKVIPNIDNDIIKIEINNEILKDSINRVSKMVDKRTNKIVFNIKDNKIVIFTSNSEFGEAKDILDIECSNEINTAINYTFLLDILNNLTENPIFYFRSNKIEYADPILILDSGNAQNKCVIMPMKIDKS